jgi:hypothetical protein
MVALLLLAVLGLAQLSYADALPTRARAIADYEIRVRLDAEAKTLEGSERITWRNPGSEPVGERAPSSGSRAAGSGATGCRRTAGASSR